MRKLTVLEDFAQWGITVEYAVPIFRTHIKMARAIKDPNEFIKKIMASVNVHANSIAVYNACKTGEYYIVVAALLNGLVTSSSLYAGYITIPNSNLDIILNAHWIETKPYSDLPISYKNILYDIGNSLGFFPYTIPKYEGDKYHMCALSVILREYGISLMTLSKK